MLLVGLLVRGREAHRLYGRARTLSRVGKGRQRSELRDELPRRLWLQKLPLDVLQLRAGDRPLRRDEPALVGVLPDDEGTNDQSRLLRPAVGIRGGGRRLLLCLVRRRRGSGHGGAGLFDGGESSLGFTEPFELTREGEATRLAVGGDTRASGRV